MIIIFFFETNINNDNIFSSYNQETLVIDNKSNFYMLEFKKNEIFDFEVNVNYFKTLKEKTRIKITLLKKETNISIKWAYNLNNIPIDGENILMEQKNLIYSLESQKDHILYTVSYNKDQNIYYSVYNQDIKPQDIVYLNKSKFSITTNKLIEIKKSDI